MFFQRKTRSMLAGQLASIADYDGNNVDVLQEATGTRIAPALVSLVSGQSCSKKNSQESRAVPASLGILLFQKRAEHADYGQAYG
jgi:hypothetical protein